MDLRHFQALLGVAGDREQSSCHTQQGCKARLSSDRMKAAPGDCEDCFGRRKAFSYAFCG